MRPEEADDGWLKAPAGYAVRPATIADLDAVVALCNAYDQADFGQPDTAREHFEEEWSSPRFDPTRHVWLVTESAGGLAGFAQAFEEHSEGVLEAFGRVHPGHQRRGIGRFLVDRMERRANEVAIAATGSARLLNAVTASDGAAQHLFDAAGYAHVRNYWHMERALGDEPVPEPPSGIRVRRFDPADARTLHALGEGAFAHHWEFQPTSFEQWAELLESPTFDPTLVLLAFAGDVPVGEVRSDETPEAGWISELGVMPEWRGRGIGTHLLRRAFADLAARGHRSVRLNVDAANESGATHLYERVGLTVRREWHVYEKLVVG